jgi:sigma-B regulation protein RsbU (phosphoserine phosphatase)
VRKAGDYYLLAAVPSTAVFASRDSTVTWVSVTAFVLLATIYVLAARLLGKDVISPIDRTNESLAKITSGNLEETVNEAGTREFASLSAGINETVGALRGLIDEAERRNERDLAVAKEIQESALPRTFPPYPEIDAFDIFAAMSTAKEVGGDFYDFFLVDDGTLGFLIADVSGKGIPGALFMMAAKTEIENYLSTGMEPAEAIASANRKLCANNDAGMFVTVWAATLDWKTGKLTYVNAGHNYPLLRHGNGGSWEWVKKKCGLFLGTFETAKYRQETLYIKPGDELLLYTDGVNEAFGTNGEEYGNDRLEAFLDAHADMHPRELVRSLRSDVARWADGAEQSDDITMLCLEYGVAPEVTGTRTVPATLEHLGEVNALIVEELEQRLCPVGVLHKVEIALEELFVNVCNYAYASSNLEEPGEVTVSYAYGTDPSSITVELRDKGVPFDPLRRDDPMKPSSIQEAKVGGLGIYMVKRTMDDIAYMRDGDENVVVFRKGW